MKALEDEQRRCMSLDGGPTPVAPGSYMMEYRVSISLMEGLNVAYSTV